MQGTTNKYLQHMFSHRKKTNNTVFEKQQKKKEKKKKECYLDLCIRVYIQADLILNAVHATSQWWFLFFW